MKYKESAKETRNKIAGKREKGVTDTEHEKSARDRAARGRREKDDGMNVVSHILKEFTRIKGDLSCFEGVARDAVLLGRKSRVWLAWIMRRY